MGYGESYYMTCKRIPWTHVWLTGAHRLPWIEVFIQLIWTLSTKIAASQNLSWMCFPVTWGLRYGWAEIIWSIEFMDLSMVYEGFLIEPPECLTLVLHGLLWDFKNSQATQGGSFITLLVFLGIIIILYSLRRQLKVQCFILWCQTKIYLFSHSKMSLV